MHRCAVQPSTPTACAGTLAGFPAEVVPTAEALGLRLCCDLDDPPFALLGLPRIVSTAGDCARLVASVPSPSNGNAFCNGSLGVDTGFDPVDFAERLWPPIHFVHLRNRTHGPMRGTRCDFTASAQLAGDTDMLTTIRALLAEQSRRLAEGRADAVIPMRPDHGHALLADLDRPMMPGYPPIVRMRGLAELRGFMATCT